MQFVPTIIEDGHVPSDYTRVEDFVETTALETDMYGLTNIIQMVDSSKNDYDFPWYPINAGPGRIVREFSIDNVNVLLEHLQILKNKKDKIVIVEIGVHRNLYDTSSTSCVLGNKRAEDIYLGIDIEDKSFLNNPERNVHTIKTSSQNYIEVLQKLQIEIGAPEIDLLIIDGYHSINAAYGDWYYAKYLSSEGIVVIHDTNAHPGPYFLLQSIDTAMFEVKKYLHDVRDWGIGVAIKKPIQSI